MGRYRSRSRSYSPKRRSRTPPRRKRYEEPLERETHHHRCRSPAPCGLLVRNVALDTRSEDLRVPFEKFGPVKDVYLPRNYYTGNISFSNSRATHVPVNADFRPKDGGQQKDVYKRWEPRGFAFVKFRFPEDASEAKDRLSHTIVGGREIRIVYAEENRKTPQEMRKSTRISGRFGARRRTSPRSPRRRYNSRSRSPVSRRHHSRSVSRSRSPRSGRYRSTERSLSPKANSYDEREGRTVGRLQSPKASSPHNEKRCKSTRRSHSSTDLSPHEGNYKSSRSPTLKENSVCESKSPRTMDGKGKQKEVSSGDDDGSNKISLIPQDILTQDDKKGMFSSPRGLSSGCEKSCRLEHGSITPERNGSPLCERNLASSSPRVNV